MQDLEQGALVLLRNSAKDGRKGDKLRKRWLGPNRIREVLGKGLYKLSNPNTGCVLKNTVNGCRYDETSIISSLYLSSFIYNTCIL